MPDISDLIEEYKKECKKMVPDNQAELVDTIIDLGLKIGVSIAQNLQAVQGTDNPEVIQLPPEDDNGAPCPRTDCFNNDCGACMIYAEGDITEFDKCGDYVDPTEDGPVYRVDYDGGAD